MDTAYCDTETNSLRNPFLIAGRRTWETAIIRVDGTTGRIKDALWIQHVDVNLADSDPMSLRLNGFHDRFSRDEGPRNLTADVPGGGQVELYGVPESRAAELIEKITRGAVIAGSNPAFDMLNFHALLDAQLLPAEGWFHHPRDVPNIATGWLRAQAEAGRGDDYEAWTGSSYQTSVLSEASGIPEPADRHAAWADAAWCYRWDAKIRGWDLALPAAA